MAFGSLSPNIEDNTDIFAKPYQGQFAGEDDAGLLYDNKGKAYRRTWAQDGSLTHVPVTVESNTMVSKPSPQEEAELVRLGISPIEKPNAANDAISDPVTDNPAANMMRHASLAGMAKGIMDSGKGVVEATGRGMRGETTNPGKLAFDLFNALPVASGVAELGVAAGRAALKRAPLGLNPSSAVRSLAGDFTDVAAPAAPKQNLVVAVRHPQTGELIVGKPGQVHGDLYNEYGVTPSRGDQGFALEGSSKFLSRDEALDWVNTNRPAAAENLTKARMGKLEAGDFNNATEMADGSYPTAPPLLGMPTTANVPGEGPMSIGPNPKARFAAQSYMERTGRTYNPPREYFPVDPQRAARVADEFERMPHNPNDPEVAASYDALIGETLDQFKDLQKSGLKIEFIKPGMKDPYAASPRLVQKDINENNHMWVYPTESGFGKEGFDQKGNPLLRDTGLEVDGVKMKANDVFRIVHDYFGHHKEGVGFRATGEDNAFRQHRAMYSPLAQRALTTETRGQNSWLNFGPHGAKNRTAKSADTVFADQKIGLMPQWTSLYANSKKAAPLSLAAASKKEPLVVARRMPDGTVKYGKPGDNHADLFTPEEIDNTYGAIKIEPHLGFAAPGGKYMSREQASEYVGAKSSNLDAMELDKKGNIRKKSALYANSKKAAPMSLSVAGDFPFDNPNAKFVAADDPFARVAGKQTVTDPVRNRYPGVYDDPKAIAREAAENVAPEDPALKQLFGVTRDDLYEMGGRGTRKGNVDEPTFARGAGKSKDAQRIMIPENAQRLGDTLREIEKASPDLVKGMDSWYVMDPAFHRLQELVGTDEAKRLYNRFNTFTGMSSPGSNVMTEINRGTAANYLYNSGRFDDFVTFGGIKESARRGLRPAFPEDMKDVLSHPYHRTAHGRPMQDYVNSGSVDMKSAKVPLYIQASGVPETGFQTRFPVGDAHFTRALGVPDVRSALTDDVIKSSMKAPLYTPIGKWFREIVAEPLGLEAVPAQARMWGTFARKTGVDTPVGAPKLELIARRIVERAKKLGIAPEQLRDEVLMGRNYSANPSSAAPFSLSAGSQRKD